MATRQTSKIKPNVAEVYEKIKDIIPEEHANFRRPKECPDCEATIGRNSSSEFDDCLAGNNVDTDNCIGTLWPKCICGAYYVKEGDKNEGTLCSMAREPCKLYNIAYIITSSRQTANSVLVSSMYKGLKSVYESLDNPCKTPGCNNSKWTPWTCKEDCQIDHLNCLATCPEDDQHCKSSCNRELDQCTNKCW